MGFILDGLDTESYDRTYGDRELLSRVLSYFRPHGRRMAVVALGLALNSLAGTAGPVLISRGIDLITVEATRGLLLLLCGGVLLLGMLAWGFSFVQQWFAAHVVGDVVLKIRDDVFAATIRNDLSFFDEHPSGKIVSRITSDTQDIADVVSLVASLLSQVLLVIILSIWLVSINVRLTLLLFAMAPFAIAIALSFRRIARRVTQRARRVTAKINAQIQESVSGIVVAKSFRQERAIYNTFAANNRQAYAIGLRRGLTLNTIFPIMGVSSGFGVALLLYFGGLATHSGVISLGSFYLFMQGVGYFWWPLIGVASFWSQFQDGLAAAERVFALIDARPRVEQVAAEPVGRLRGGIEFRDVRFSYVTGAERARSDEIVLDGFSLAVRPQETLALVGHTGAGKSSIAKLLMRFYEFQAGEILIDGRDIRRLDLAEYRRQVGLVPQEPFLFSGSVRDNIRYGLTDADDRAVLAAARQISDGDWLGDLPDGLDTDVGERGANLSMGQRQLVALARVLLRDPALFILDEATASVDPFTEEQIRVGLDAVMRDRTALIIAHRLSTVRRADRIIVMERGRIIEEGTHDALLQAGGHYAELYNTYFRHQSLAYIEEARRQA